MSAADRGRAFTNAETFFQFAWVVGALIPVVPGSSVGLFSLPTLPVEAGLIVAGLIALSIQVIYVSAVLGPVVAARRRIDEPSPDPPRHDGDVLDLLG